MGLSLNNFVDLTDSQLAILKAFENDAELCRVFYFTGGTLLKARGIVPRISNDLDFFTFPSVEHRAFFENYEKFRTLLVRVFGEDALIETDRGILHRPSSTVIDMIHDTTRSIDNFVAFGNLMVAGILDVAASKASALCSRDEIKDYIDIAFITKVHDWSLTDLEEMAEKKYGLGTVTEEKLLTELIAKQSQFHIPPDIFLRQPEENKKLVESQIAVLIDRTAL